MHRLPCIFSNLQAGLLKLYESKDCSPLKIVPSMHNLGSISAVVRGLFKDAIIVSPDRWSTNASTDGILCCQKEATFNLKDVKSRIVPYFSQLILQTPGKGLVSPLTTARHDPETGFEWIRTH